jgi:hypothetical protein
MGFESLKELKQDLLFCLFALQDIRVAVCLVSVFDVLNIEIATFVSVDLAEGLFNELGTVRIHLSSNSIKEFIDV